MQIADLRKDYARESLDEGSVLPSPIDQFKRWLEAAIDAKVPEPTAMSVATVGEGGRPSSRMVLLKEVDARGFVFFTNYESRKGRELTRNAFASLLFFWPELERQVRIEGRTSEIESEASDAYFHSRPLTSRIGAWASPQSQPLTKTALLARVAEATVRHGLSPERPPHWGGYRVEPDRLEFWQGRPSRLHDRILYTRTESGWELGRLSP